MASGRCAAAFALHRGRVWGLGGRPWRGPSLERQARRAGAAGWLRSLRG